MQTRVEKCHEISAWSSLGYSARESRQDLSGRVSILQSRFDKAQVSDVQETNRVVRLAKAHADLALPVCKIPVDQICLVSYGDTSGGSTRAEQAKAGYVIMIADRVLLEGLSHRVKRVVATASAAEAMCWSEAIAQGDSEHALWSEVLLGLSLRDWTEQEKVPPLSCRSRIRKVAASRVWTSCVCI